MSLGPELAAAALPLTQLLAAMQAGDPSAKDQVFRLAYDQLRRLAARLMARERAGHTLRPTALLHEAFASKLDGAKTDYRDRQHFYAIAALAMRQVLVEYARRRKATKRASVEAMAADAVWGRGPGPETLITLEQALRRLEKLDGRAARLVELRYLLGFSLVETAAILGVTERTVREEWGWCKKWLRDQMAGHT